MKYVKRHGFFPVLPVFNMSYQSPISLHKRKSIRLSTDLHLHGKNRGASYDSKKRVFWVNDPISLLYRSKHYRLVEYHFHMPREYQHHDHGYDAEIHYVFTEVDDPERDGEKRDVCGGESTSEPILVLGRMIRHESNAEQEHLAILQVEAGCRHFEYDGTLTTEDVCQVRWLVGTEALYIDVDGIASVAKGGLPLQETNGRIILFNEI